MLTWRYVIVGLAYAAIVEIGVGNVPTQINQISLVRQVLGILRPILGNDAGLTRAALTSSFSTPAIVVLLLAFAAAMIALTAVLFSTREFAGAAGRE